MIVRCSECNAAYQVDDEKVENKRFAFTCPKCRAHVIIDNRVESMPDISMAEVETEQSFEQKPQKSKVIDEFDAILMEESSKEDYAETTGADKDLLADIESFDEESVSKPKAEEFE